MFSVRLEQDDRDEPLGLGQQLPGLTRCPWMKSRALAVPLDTGFQPAGTGEGPLDPSLAGNATASSVIGLVRSWEGRDVGHCGVVTQTQHVKKPG